MIPGRVLPQREDFPAGSRFVIKEFDVPLVQGPDGRWSNWFGGSPRPYDVTGLRVDNNWPAESFEAWQQLVADSIPREP